MRFSRCCGLVLVAALAMAGCGSSSSLRVGQKLLDTEGKEWGTILELSDARTFENGETEPGALVDYAQPQDIPDEPPHWIPQDSIERSLDASEKEKRPASNQNSRAYDQARKALMASGKVSALARFPDYQKDFVTWTGPGTFEVESTVQDPNFEGDSAQGWTANVQWVPDKGWQAEASLLKPTSTITTPANTEEKQAAQEDEAEKQEQEERETREREETRRGDIAFHEGKIKDLERDRKRLVDSLATNLSPDVVQQDIEGKDRAIAQEEESIRVIMGRGRRD